MRQERQLEDKRLMDEQLRLIEQVRQTLLSQLEQTKLEEVTRMAAHGVGAENVRAGSPVAFVGAIVDGRLQLPWENNAIAQKFRDRLTAGNFAERIRRAEAQELITRQYAAAARQYREAVASAGQPDEQSYARLLLARTLHKLGRSGESEAEYARVLTTPPDLVDEHGVPLGLYAAPPLLQVKARQKELIEWIRAAEDRSGLWPPAALRMTRDLAAGLGASDSVSSLTGLIREREHAETLERDLARFMPATPKREPVWTFYTEPGWLVSMTPPVNTFEGLVIAVRVNEALNQLNMPQGPVRLATASDTAGQRLGENFAGLRVVLPPPQTQNIGLRQTVLVSALVLSLAFTLLAGYLLWRDAQRNLRLAEMRSQFVSSVTHELKTPLTAIRMFTETLRLDEEVDRQTRLEYLDTILHESERLSRLVDNVLDFGKIERGKKTYRFQPCRLQEVVEDAARAAQYPLQQAGFALEIAAEPDLPQVRADSDALQQAILNLLINAMKYSGDSRRIVLRLDRENGHARIHVVDEGVGIAPEEQGRIFESFYRAPTAENMQIPGTGLGLTIVAHIAKAHGGDVDVASSLGHGSSFTIRLPIMEKEPA